jgi:phosphoribosyl 1,2-cyclic phosphodiesterase
VRLRLRVLASGSSGNAALVTAHDGARRHDLLIDLGLSPRRLGGLLRAEGTDLESLTGVLLTHGDVDHLHTGWARAWPTLMAPPIVLRPAHGHVPARAGLVHAATRWIHDELALGPFALRALALPHDSEGSTAFRIQFGEASIAWVTDLGRVIDGLPSFVAGAGALGLESNYDPPMQRASPRPEHLKRRIMEGHGHLSNEQALALVRELHRLDAAPRHVVLLHLSEQCNHPDLVRTLWHREAPALAPRMRVANRREPCEPIELHATGAVPA